MSISRIALILAGCISVVLLIAAWGKLFYPMGSLKTFDRWVGMLEIFFIAFLLLFRKKPLMWLCAAAVFAAWGGYAIYWHHLHLPCSCMGAIIQIPSWSSIVIDLLFFSLSLIVSYFLGASFSNLYLAVLISCFLSFGGYIFADWIHEPISETVHELRLRRFSGLFWPLFDSNCRGNIR